MKLPSLTPRKVIKRFQKAGFAEIRQSDSHKILSHPKKEVNVVLPFHNKDIKKGTLRGIIR